MTKHNEMTDQEIFVKTVDSIEAGIEGYCELDVTVKSSGVTLVDLDARTVETFSSRQQVTDKYHSFDELYLCRYVLFAALCNAHPDKSWKSLKHSSDDQPMFDGYFIAGIETNEGQFTFHMPMDVYSMFKVEVLERAPEWDGHVTSDVTRLLNI